MEKIIEECPDKTPPTEMEECVNDEVDDENKRNLILKMRQNLMMKILQKLTIKSKCNNRY